MDTASFPPPPQGSSVPLHIDTSYLCVYFSKSYLYRETSTTRTALFHAHLIHRTCVYTSQNHTYIGQRLPHAQHCFHLQRQCYSGAIMWIDPREPFIASGIDRQGFSHILST